MSAWCPICDKGYWEDHSVCDAIALRHEQLSVMESEKRTQTIIDNPWLKAFEFEFDMREKELGHKFES